MFILVYICHVVNWVCCVYTGVYICHVVNWVWCVYTGVYICHVVNWVWCVYTDVYIYVIGECKEFMDCLKKFNYDNADCRLESKAYLECRMKW